MTEGYTSARIILERKPKYVVLEKSDNAKDNKLVYIQDKIKDKYHLVKEATYHLKGHINLKSRKVWVYAHN
jgi:hypothetical protein